MKMKRFLVLIILAETLSMYAAAPSGGADRLRELAVFPAINLKLDIGIDFRGDAWAVSDNTNPEVAISRLREHLKEHPDDVRELLKLANLLDENNDTNAARACYLKVEQLCRDPAASGLGDGLALTELGEALWKLGKNKAAQSAFRKAVLVSSNDWQCWVRLGNFLENEPFPLMFPEDLRSQIGPSPTVPAQEIWDYRPSPDALEKTEAMCKEASRCFDRAAALGPKESEVFFQRAGYMAVSNWQNCFFRHYRNDEKIESSQWPLAFFSSQTIANLKRAAQLSPKNYQYISLAAYFEWFRALIQANWPSNYTVDMLPDKTRQSIHQAMNQLEKLSRDAHKKMAAGALENLGVLNMAFGNREAATSDFRRAIALDPTREQSWDALLGMMVDSASPDELVKLCKSRLKVNKSARNHLLLAKAFAKERQWEEATEQALTATELDTNDVVAPLMLCALYIKQSAKPGNLTLAMRCFYHVMDLYKNLPTYDEKVKRWREMTLDEAIISGLHGQPKDAKDELNSVLEHFPNDETAKEILRALN